MLNTPDFYVLISFLVFFSVVLKFFQKKFLTGLNKKIKQIEIFLEESYEKKNESQKALNYSKTLYHQALQKVEEIQNDFSNQSSRLEKEGLEKIDSIVKKNKDFLVKFLATLEKKTLDSISEEISFRVKELLKERDLAENNQFFGLSEIFEKKKI